MRTFNQLTAADRRLIGRYRKRELSLTDIAEALGVSKSTVSRELKRNSNSNGIYRHRDAQWKRNGRNQRAMAKRPGWLLPTTHLWIRRALVAKWSPEQIAGRSRIDGPQPVSHESIYRLIRHDRRHGGTLHRFLRRDRRHRRRARCKRKYEKLLGRIDISKRPKIVERRTRLGDLEGDTIIGRHQQSHIVVVADRVSRLVGLAKVRSKARHHVNRGLKKLIARNGHAKTLTVDNGLEFSGHRSLNRQTGLKIFFAHAYSAWERGTVENMNRLIRQYLPKKTDFRRVSERQLRQIERELNNRPRKCLGYRTPYERHITTTL